MTKDPQASMMKTRMDPKLLSRLPPPLASRVVEYTSRCPESVALIVDIISTLTTSTIASPSSQPAVKKRKVGDISDSTAINIKSEPFKAPPHEPTLLTLKTLSFNLPFRKQASLTLTRSSLIITLTKDAETHAFALTDIDAILATPTPNCIPTKKGKKFSISIFTPSTQICFSFDDAIDVETSTPTGLPLNTPKKDLVVALLKKYINVSAIEPTEDVFYSAASKKVKSGNAMVMDYVFHISAKKSAQDWYLWPLPTCLFLGLKKPLVYIPLPTLKSLQVTTVTSSTTAIKLTTTLGASHLVEMIPGEEFEGLMRYFGKVKPKWRQDLTGMFCEPDATDGDPGGDDDEESDGLGTAPVFGVNEEESEDEDYDPAAIEDTEDLASRSAGSGSGDDDDDSDDSEEDEEEEEEGGDELDDADPSAQQTKPSHKKYTARMDLDMSQFSDVEEDEISKPGLPLQRTNLLRSSPKNTATNLSSTSPTKHPRKQKHPTRIAVPSTTTMTKLNVLHALNANGKNSDSETIGSEDSADEDMNERVRGHGSHDDGVDDDEDDEDNEEYVKEEGEEGNHSNDNPNDEDDDDEVDELYGEM